MTEQKRSIPTIKLSEALLALIGLTKLFKPKRSDCHGSIILSISDGLIRLSNVDPNVRQVVDDVLHPFGLADLKMKWSSKTFDPDEANAGIIIEYSILGTQKSVEHLIPQPNPNKRYITIHNTPIAYAHKALTDRDYFSAVYIRLYEHYVEMRSSQN